jgi:hypothetical protein
MIRRKLQSVGLSVLATVCVFAPFLAAKASDITDADASMDAVYGDVKTIVLKWATRIVMGVISIGLLLMAPKLLTAAYGAIVSFRARRAARRAGRKG